MADQNADIATDRIYYLLGNTTQGAMWEQMRIAFNQTSDAVSSLIKGRIQRPSPEEQVSIAREQLDEFKRKCLRPISFGYQVYLRFASPEKAKKLVLRVIYVFFEWPGDVLYPGDLERIRRKRAVSDPDTLTQWLLRAGFSLASGQQLFDLPSIRREVESAFQRHLDQEKREAQRELLVELRVKKTAAEALAILREGAETEKTTRPSKRLGRTPTLPPEFVNLAGTLWLTRDTAEPKTAQLRKIAALLDAKGWGPPAKYLEGEWAEKLKTYNSHHSTSKAGAVKTWAQLVATANKHQLLRGMAKLLSRCAGRVRTGSTGLSGN
jgi:hypothetical protein